MSALKYIQKVFGSKSEVNLVDLIDNIKANKPIADVDFDAIFSDDIKRFAQLHFSPIEICKHVTKFLTQKNPLAKILDIGSGTGKFCIIGSLTSLGGFTGVEQRESLHNIATEIAESYFLDRINFVLGNIVNIKFEAFDGFYIFNSFYENVSFDENITDEVNLSQPLYDSYSAYVKQELDNMPIGTRLATYFCSRSIAPDSYELIVDDFNENLKLWEKII